MSLSSSFLGHSLSFVRLPPKPFTTTPRAVFASSRTLPLKTRLHCGDKLQGMLLFSASPTMAEIASLSGYNFVVVDLEHGPSDFLAALHCMRAAATSGCKTVIRVPETSTEYAKKALDLGPEKIMFPKVETGEAAAEAVSFCSYPPHGVHGCAFTLVRDSAFGFDKSYLEHYWDNRLIMCQVTRFHYSRRRFDAV